ncbi:AAA-ATPase ASD, mitochondrial [Vitis vinifera]|uniref:AAA-ATPase ASD, mitochondrial n=1 Tax=Vitis vinifera TaxID=29760 RepID=A0A438EG52_VITVI|nr:AAA-ATPase ASD, mitochondrial [Vitis vinifera]
MESKDMFGKILSKLVNFFNPYIEITFNEFTGQRGMRSEAYKDIQNYLGYNSTRQASRLKGSLVKNGRSLVLGIDDYEEVVDVFEGVQVWWISGKQNTNRRAISIYPVRGQSDDKRYYTLLFHKRHRDLISGPYLNYVLKEGKALKDRNRPEEALYQSGGRLALGRESWESLEARVSPYGPPGTGKSTMIAAIANLLNYDVYDLELTGVENNTDLKMLLMEISSKAVIVIEDIDCSLDLTGQRKKAETDEDSDEEEDEKGKKEGKEKGSKTSKVTLSGLLNFIDGLWSACGGERVIVFTTNHVEKLDQALIRKGRMDKHIELSYCSYEAFKVLAKNYLNVDSHPRFSKISELLGEVNMTPADVAEHLTIKTIMKDAGIRLEGLISALERRKEARLAAIEDKREKKLAAKGAKSSRKRNDRLRKYLNDQ